MFFQILLAFLRLGCTSFGGPIAHLGYFREEFVARRRWLSDHEFADVVALAQTLPGPASSQTGFAIGLLRGGWLGGVAAWLGFTLPSALLMFGFAYAQRNLTVPGVVHGLQIVAVAVVAQAVLSMQRALAPDRTRASLAVIAAAITVLCPAPFNTLVAIAFGAAAGLAFLSDPLGKSQPSDRRLHGRRSSTICLLLFAALFAVRFLPSRWAVLFSNLYRSGALVFGGGHVVLPLLESSVVANGFVPERAFLAGYGAVQAVPGPLFTFSAYLGAVAAGPLGSLLALLAIFLPGLLLMAAVLPFWTGLSRSIRFKATLTGVNAAVVGLLAAALYSPIWTSTIHLPVDFAIALGAFTLLTVWKLAPWQVVIFSIVAAVLVAIV